MKFNTALRQPASTISAEEREKKSNGREARHYSHSQCAPGSKGQEEHSKNKTYLQVQ